MKKVLLLGGSRYLIPVIEAVHALGYQAITCDYLPNNYAHQYSDEYYNVSIVEKDRVLQLAQSLSIDGILSFACDPGVETAAYVAEKMGLPGCPYQSVKVLQNKALFRSFLEKNGFCVPKAKGYCSVADAAADAAAFRWPVIVKPADSAGSKGVTKITQIDQLQSAAETAMHHSIAGQIIIEEFIEKRGYSSDSDCFSIDGKLAYVSFSDQRFDAKAPNPYTPSAYSWPSTMPFQVQAELRSELQRLCSLLKLGTSIYNVETRQGIDGKAYIMEVSPRGGGNRLSEMLRYASGVDLITNCVHAAVGDTIEDITDDPIYQGYWAEQILHSDRDGVLEELWIDPAFERKFVARRDLWISPGDEVHSFTGANFAVGTLALRFESQAQLEEYLGNIDKYVKLRLK